MAEWKKCRKLPVVVEFREPSAQLEVIDTREGRLYAYRGQDYVIRGVDGEEYPIKKEIFNRTYEVVE